MILDVLTIAIGFVLRAAAGAVAIAVRHQPLALLLTILLALFLALSKRRHELVLLADGATGHRRILEEYSPYLLDQMIAVVTASTLVAYAFYTVSPETVQKFGTDRLVLTLPFPLYGIFRYLYLVHQKEGGGSPSDMLLTDRPLLFASASGPWRWPSSFTARAFDARTSEPCQSQSRHPSHLAGHGSRDYHSLMNLAGYQDVIAQGRGYRAQGQHLLALLLPGQLDDAVAARGRDPRDEAGRLRPVADARLPQPHRRHRRASRRAREQAGQRRRRAQAAQHPHLRNRRVDQHPRGRRRSDEEVHSASTRSTRRAS